MLRLGLGTLVPLICDAPVAMFDADNLDCAGLLKDGEEFEWRTTRFGLVRTVGPVFGGLYWYLAGWGREVIGCGASFSDVDAYLR